MKAISLWQPYASLCVMASVADATRPAKMFETRSWQTKHRGRVMIHAAKTMKGWKDFDIHSSAAYLWLCLRMGVLENKWDLPRALPLGALVGSVSIESCRQCQPDIGLPVSPGEFARTVGDYSPGRWAWELRDPVQYDPAIPYRGSQGFFNVEDGGYIDALLG